MSVVTGGGEVLTTSCQNWRAERPARKKKDHLLHDVRHEESKKKT